ncbi:MAG: DUF5121 domain-containing protein [Bacteroidales bacterium]|jgi:hypothetical protein|nr:DUF5121 domain-containing protein [Bacteroidales bacterium]MCI1784620.1 DUF5121 domain-containing protein [Bacteroidales bacterium]
MNRLITISALAAAVLSFAACQDDGMKVKFTDVGPEMNIVSCDQSAFMGDSVRFSVSLTDDFPLSTLKAKLMFDETDVSDVTIRTKENGTYEGAISVPLYADIPDGTATLVFTGQNTGLGKTEKSVDVNISRPNSDYLTLTVNGTSYRMDKTADYQYAVTASFPAIAPGIITTSAIDDAGHVISLGWDGSAIKAGSPKDIPFNAVKAGTYKISVNLLTLVAEPFGKITSSLNESSTTETINLLQGSEIDFSGISNIENWDLDYDFFTLNDDNTVTFKAVDGLYKLTADFSAKFIKVEAMSDSDTPASLQDNGTGAIWVIGSGFGKPSIGPSWDTNDGAYCLSQISSKVYQLTLTAGSSITRTGYSIKFFYQKGWGGEFDSYSSVNDLTGLFQVTSSGNVEQAGEDVSLEVGKSYQFTIDVTNGPSAATLKIEQVAIPVKTLDIKVNGLQASRLSATHYQIPSVDLTKDGTITVTGISDLSTWYLDPDYLYLDGSSIKFNAVSGKFAIDLYLDLGYVEFRRLTSSGTEAKINDGALWLMGWGVADPVMTKQIGFTEGAAFCMAEVEPMVFRFTGTAVAETDGTTLGGRIRYDYISAKYFGQDGWGNECGKILGSATTVSLTNLAAEYFSMSDSYNIELKDAETKPLEKGAVYVLTVDLSKTASTGVEVIDLVKK